jgi:hypothetical protein
MAKQMRYTVLPVGQGSGALVEVLENGTLQAPVLIDLGSRGWNKQAGQPSAAFVAERLDQMANPKLAAVFISHVDSDHVNLLRRLLERFKKRGGAGNKKTLEIGDVWFGGKRSDYDSSRDRPLQRLEEYGATIHTLGLKESDVAAGATRFSYAGVEYSLLIANVADPDSEEKRARTDTDTDTDTGAVSRKRAREANGFLRNVVSLVVVVKFGTITPQYIVAPGDAIGLTLAECNKILNSRPGIFAPVLTLALPHHGSATSTYDLTGVRKVGDETSGELAARVVREFVNHLQAHSITASAGENPTYRHPSSRVIADFARTVQKSWYQDGTTPGEHFFTAYYELNRIALQGGKNRLFWPFTTGWYTGRTESNVFTIDYFRGNPQTSTPLKIVFDPSRGPDDYPLATYGLPNAPYGAGTSRPPRAAGWGFPIAEDGQSEAVERLFDLRFASAEERASLESVHGPLPPRRFVFLPSVPAPGPAPEAGPPPAVVREAAVPPPSPPAGLRRMRQLP